MVGQRLSPRHELHPGLHQRRRLRRHVRRSASRTALEIFGSFLFDTRIDRDLRPIFINDPDVGRLRRSLPAHGDQRWSGDNVGDFYIGAKVNLMSESRSKAGGPRRARHLQGADRRRGRRASHRQVRLRASISSSARSSGAVVELSGFAGYEFRGNRTTSRSRVRRVPLGRWRRVPVAQPAPRHRRSQRRAVPNDDVATHHAPASLIGDRRFDLAARVGD